MLYDLRTARLDIVFEQAVLALYRGWYALPRRATQPHLEPLRERTACALEALAGAGDTTAVEQAFVAFATRARSLPGVEDVCLAPSGPTRGANIVALLMRAAAGRSGLRPATATDPERVQALVTLLRQAEPVAYAIGLLVYDPNRAPESWQALWAQLQTPTVWNALTSQEQARASAAAEQLTMSLAVTRAPVAIAEAYVAALLRLETIPAGVRMLSAAAPEHLLRYKCEPPPPTYLSGGMAVPGEPRPPVAVAQGATSPDEGGEVRPLHTDVRFPPNVKLYDEQRLTVRLTAQRADGTVADETLGVVFPAPPPGQPTPPEFVEVRLLAPGFEEVSVRAGQDEQSEMGTRWERTLKVYPDRPASQTAVFILRAEREGEHQVHLDFYQRERMLGSVAFPVHVSRDGSSEPARQLTLPQSSNLAAFPANPPPPADLELRVTKADTQNRLYFVLNSTRPEVPFRNQAMGEIKLTAGDPAIFLADQAAWLSQLARDAVGNLTPELISRLQDQMAVLGEGLFEQLLPPQLQAAYWQTIKPLQEQGIIQSLLITSDEPWIPWELIKPYNWDAASGSEQTDAFWAESFQLCRWLAGRGPGGHIEASAATLIIPSVGLPAAVQEVTFFDELAATGRLQVHGPLRGREEVLAAVRAGGFQLLHVATHGEFNASDVNQSEIVLQDASIRPEDLKGSRLRGLRAGRPLIFFNACNGSRAAYALTGLGGWAQTLFVDANAGAFVGALWAIEDELAAAFSHAFYTGLAGGQTLGEAIQAARREVRNLAPANPTWLAYTLYGDPNARVAFGLASPTSGQP